MAEKKQAGKADAKSAKKSPAKKPNKAVKFFKDLKSEFKKVVWPSKKTVVNNTSVVLVTMVVCGLAIWGIDSAFAALLGKLLSMAG
ncbi:MAG: preprotein translocase subunit SecE [Ruminococcus sp.]|nr:preprotein translocase subunit SecE [Ruminococcus sp.]